MLILLIDSFKGLANGFPLSGVVSSRELTNKLVPGSMVSWLARCQTYLAVADRFIN